MLFPQIFVGLFTSDEALLEFGQPALRIYMACMFLFGIQLACQMTFTSLGNAAASIVVAIMRKFVLLIPLIYILPAIFSQDKTSAVLAFRSPRIIYPNYCIIFTQLQIYLLFDIFPSAFCRGLDRVRSRLSVIIMARRT